MKAFPHIAKVHLLEGNTIVTEEVTSGGMDLRDYFAAKAMQFQEWHYYTRDGKTEMDLGIAKRCYDMADAMMKAREQ